MCISNLILTACIACKIQVRNRQNIKLIHFDFSNSIFQKLSADQQGGLCISLAITQSGLCRADPWCKGQDTITIALCRS